MKIRKVSFDTEEEMEEVITADNYKFSKYVVDQAFYQPFDQAVVQQFDQAFVHVRSHENSFHQPPISWWWSILVRTWGSIGEHQIEPHE